MTRLEGKVNNVRTRLALLEFAASAVRLLFYLSAVAAILVFADRLFHLGHTTALVLGAPAAAAVIAWLVITGRRISADYAARRIDGKFGLQERISTALAMGHSHEPMLPALAADAEHYANNIDPSRFRFDPPRELKFLPAPMLALAICLLAVPPMDILGRQQRHEKRQAEQERIKNQANHLRTQALKLERTARKEKLPEAKKLAHKMQKLAEDLARSPKTKQSAMIRMSKLSDETRKQRERFRRAEEFGKLDLGKSASLKTKIGKLGEAKKAMQKLANALNAGELAAAAEALKDLAEKLKDGSISPEEARKLSEALKELAENMSVDDELAQALAELAKQLQSLNGLDAARLAQALQQMQLTRQEMLELLKMIQEMKACDFALDVLEYERMALSRNKPGRPCAKCGKFGCMGIGCMGLQGTGMGGMGPVMQKGPFGGGGLGQRPLAEKQPVEHLSTKVQGKLTPGKILGVQFQRGMPTEGSEAKAEYQEVLTAARKAAEDAIRREDIPPQLREKIKGYFGDLEKK